MSVYNLGSNRMVCWDEFLIDKISSAEVRMHKPVKRELVLTADQDWEGNVCGYGSLIKVGDKYRLYYRAQNYVNWRRYTMRLDGFVSWYAKYSGGEVLTKPFTFEGNELELNFETGAMGTLIVTVCDENGNELEGYKTCEMFGDTVGRPAVFQKELKALEGKPIRLKFFLKDCDLYSFKFN